MTSSRLVLRGLSTPAAIAYVVLAVLTALAIAVSMCAALLAEVAGRLAEAGQVAATAVREADSPHGCGHRAAPAGYGGRR